MPGWIIDKDHTQSSYNSAEFEISESLSPQPSVIEPQNSTLVTLNNEVHCFYRSYHYKWTGTEWVSVSTPPYSVYGADSHAVVLNNEIHLLGTGGYHYKWTGTEWVSVSTNPYPSGYSIGSVVVYRGEIHVLGEYNNTTGSALTSHRKWNGTTWTSPSVLPYGFFLGGAVVLNDEIHILGGVSHSTGLTYHYKWKYGDNDWTPVSTLPYPFYQGVAVVLNNEIHILGGSSYNTNHYKWNGSSWSSVSTLPFGVTSINSGVILHNHIHIVGQTTVYSYTFNAFRVYNNSEWVESYQGTIEGTLPYDFHGGNAVFYRGEIHILGGGNHETSHYKWDGSSWVSVSTLPVPIYDYYNGQYTVVYHDKIHLMDHDHHYVWDGSSWSSLPHHISLDNDFAGMVVFEDAIHFIVGNEHYRWTEENGIQLVHGTMFWDYEIGRTSMVVYNGDIHIFGSKGNGSTLHMYYSKQYRDWYAGTSCPFDMSVTSVVVFNGLVHAFGSRASGYTRKHVTFDGLDWTTLSNMPYDFYQASAVVTSDNKIALLGSGYSSYYDRFYYYLEIASTYKIVDIWTKEVYTNASSEQGFIYKMKNVLRAWIGDAQGKAKLVMQRKPYASAVTDSNPDDVNMYISSGGQMNSRQYVFTFNNKLYGLSRGGQKKFRSFLNGSWDLDSSIADLPENYDYGQLVDVGGVLHYLMKDGFHYIYDGSSWISKNRTPTAVSLRIVAGTLNGKLYILQSSAGTSNGYLYEWDSTNDSWKPLSRSPFYHEEEDPPAADQRILPYRNVLIPYENKLYLFYYTLLSSVSVVYVIYDPETNTWSQEKTVESDISDTSVDFSQMKVFDARNYLIILGPLCDYIYDFSHDRWDKITSEDAYYDGVVVGRSEKVCASVLDGELHIVRHVTGTGGDEVIHEKLSMLFLKSSNNEEEEEIVVVDDGGGTVTEEPLGG